MDSKVILTAAGIGTILLLLSRRRRQQRQDNEQINNVVESTNVNDTLAARLKDLLNDMTTGKTIALTRWTLVGKVRSLIFKMLQLCGGDQEKERLSLLCR